MVLDRYRIAKGLVGTFEVVFDKPVSELAIENIAVRCHVPQGNELILEGAVEPLIEGIVGGSLGTGEILRQRK